MGNSSSVLDVSNVFRSFLTAEMPSREKLDAVFGFTLRNSEMEQVLPLDTIRALRHGHTRNFALLLHRCIQEVGAMAARKEAANAAGPFAAASIPSEAVPRFLTALQVLRRLLPVAMEAGNTPLESEAAAAAAAATASAGAGAGAPPQSSLPSASPNTANSGSTSGAGDSAVEMTQQSGELANGSGGGAPADEVTLVARLSGAGARAAEPPPAPPPPGGIRRTAATVNFQARFFHHCSVCDDDNHGVRFPPLPGQQQQQQRQPDSAVPAATAATPNGDGAETTTMAMVPLGAYLAWALVECCFIRGLTLDPELALGATLEPSRTHPGVTASLLWAPGLGSADPNAAPAARPAAAVSAARRALLQALLSVTSAALFHPANHRDTIFMEPLISVTHVPLMPTLAVSMLNTVMGYTPYGLLPYSSHVVGDEEQVVVAAARLLCATLSYSGIPIDSATGGVQAAARRASSLAAAAVAAAASGGGGTASDGATTPGRVQNRSQVFSENGSFVGTGLPATAATPAAAVAPSSHVSDPGSNNGSTAAAPAAAPTLASSNSNSNGTGNSRPLGPRLVHCVRKTVHDISMTEAKLLLERLDGLIGLRTYASQTIMPSSQRGLNCEEDIMMLLWRLIELSPSAYTQFSANPCVLSYLVALMHYAMDARRSPRVVDHLQLTLFILGRLSEVRSFVLLCNQPFTGFIPFPFPRRPATSTTAATPATFNDFLVISLCQLLETRELAASPLLTSCGVVLANLAPYVTNLGAVSSQRLVGLFAHYAQRSLRLSAVTSIPGSPLPLSASPSMGVAAAAAVKPQQQQQQQQSHYQQPPSAPSSAPHTPVTATPAATTEKLALTQSVLVHVTEAIASLLQYHETGARHLLAALTDHAGVVHKTREVYLVTMSRPMLYHSSVPFLADCLDDAVAVALPVVESAVAMSVGFGPGKWAAATAASPAGDANTVGAMDETLAALSATPAPVVPSVAENPAVMSRLSELTLVGALPTPHRITTRRMQSTRQSELWALSSFWTGMYVHTPGGWMGDRRSVKLLRFAQ